MSDELFQLLILLVQNPERSQVVGIDHSLCLVLVFSQNILQHFPSHLGSLALRLQPNVLNSELLDLFFVVIPHQFVLILQLLVLLGHG